MAALFFSSEMRHTLMNRAFKAMNGKTSKTKTDSKEYYYYLKKLFAVHSQKQTIH